MTTPPLKRSSRSGRIPPIQDKTLISSGSEPSVLGQRTHLLQLGKKMCPPAKSMSLTIRLPHSMTIPRKGRKCKREEGGRYSVKLEVMATKVKIQDRAGIVNVKLLCYI